MKYLSHDKRYVTEGRNERDEAAEIAAVEELEEALGDLLGVEVKATVGRMPKHFCGFPLVLEDLPE